MAYRAHTKKTRGRLWVDSRTQLYAVTLITSLRARLVYTFCPFDQSGGGGGDPPHKYWMHSESRRPTGDQKEEAVPLFSLQANSGGM